MLWYQREINGGSPISIGWYQREVRWGSACSDIEKKERSKEGRGEKINFKPELWEWAERWLQVSPWLGCPQVESKNCTFCQKFLIKNLENTKADQSFNFWMFYSFRVLHTRPDPGHYDNQDRGDVGGKEKMAWELKVQQEAGSILHLGFFSSWRLRPSRWRFQCCTLSCNPLSWPALTPAEIFGEREKIKDMNGEKYRN